MDSEGRSDSIPIPSKEAIVPLTFECNVIEDLQRDLRQMVEANSRSLIPVRVSTHFYLGQYAIFNVVSAKKPGRASSGNDLAESVAIGSSAEGLKQSVHESMAANPMKLTGNFTTVDAVMNQPDKDPVLQSGVARSIIASIREVDGFGWSVRHKSRTQKHGWQVEYFCQDSHQNRDRKRNSLRRARTGSDRTFETSGVPTFDCRGSIVVIFSSSLGKIIVKYAHSPIHRTVASRKEMNSAFTAKTKKGPEQHNERTQSQQSSSLDPDNRQWSSYQTTRLVVYAPNEDLHQRALSLLSDNAIEANSLSEEQMRIFENQPPDLQARSVQLLKEYGPASLGVMTHQSLDNQITQSFQAHTTLPWLGGTPTISRSYPEPPPPECQSEAEHNGGSDVQLTPSVESQHVKRTRSRAGCWQCRKDRVKCDEAHPICTRCAKNGDRCAWPSSMSDNASKTVVKHKRGRPRKAAPTAMQDSPASGNPTGPS